MTDLQLDYDEGILLQGEGGYRSADTEDEVSEMVLTTKNIICVIEKSTGLFKSHTEVMKIPLASIRVVNGQPQVAQMNHPEHGIGMQILYTNGKREHYSFYGGTGAQKKEIAKWIGAITQAITGVAPVEPSHQPSKVSKMAKTKAPAFAGLGAITAGLQSVVDTAKQTIEETTRQFSGSLQPQVEHNSQDEMVYAEPATAVPPVPAATSTPQAEQQCFFCSNCGQKLNVGVKFCHSCGNAVKAPEPPASVATAPPPVPPVPPVVPPQVVEPPKPRRRQEFVGTVLKCPNCGAVVSETTVICHDCGIRITRRSAVSSVQEFKDQLMAIESGRKKKFAGMLNLSVDPADMQKLSLIRIFPIPNSIDDILEFMLLAIANIDVVLSKNSMMNKYNSSFKTTETSQTITKTISDAWVAKMQQAYQKAEIMFPNDPAFAGIQRLYFEKMKELKFKI